MGFNFLFLLLLIPFQTTAGTLAPFVSRAASMRSAFGPMNLNKLRSISTQLAIPEMHKASMPTMHHIGVQNASIGESKFYQQKNSLGMRTHSSTGLNAARSASVSAAILTSQTSLKVKKPRNKVKEEINVKIANSQKIGNIKKVKRISMKVKKMLTKILGIPVKIGIDNENEGSIESENEIIYLNAQNFAGHEDAIEIGEEIIRAICGGTDCDIDYGMPENYVNMCSLKPKPGEDELERALRPMALKLAAKLGKGKLWVDNPSPVYRNMFEVAYKIESDDPNEIEKIVDNLDKIVQKTPIQFIPATQLHAKNVLHFSVHDEENNASNGLSRGKNNFVKINKNELGNSENVQKLVLKALGVDYGKDLRIEYNRRDELLFGKLEMYKLYAQLNAAYGAENYFMQNDGVKISEDGKYFKEHYDTHFWMYYPNMKTGKYEIPVVFDESFIKQAEEHKDLLDHVFKTFAKKSVVQFKVYKKPPKGRQYARIYGSLENEHKAWARVECWDEKTWEWYKDNDYKGIEVGFGAKAMDSYTLFHELLHICGLSHEHQRADAQNYVEFDHEKAKHFHDYDDYNVGINFATRLLYLPVSPYNPLSIMHYDMRAMKPVCDGFNGIPSCENYPAEPHELDWVNLNHFYGVGKGRTTFKVENGKIVEDLDGISRLKK